jgi:hypothetical protein
MALGRRPGLLRLPFSVDVAAGAGAAAALPAAAFRSVQDGGQALGGVAVPLVSPGGVDGFDFSLAGPAAATAVLAGCAPLGALLASLLSAVPTSVARARVVRGQPGVTPAAACLSYHYFRRRTLVTALQPAGPIWLMCGEDRAAISAGEVWQIDRRQPHHIENPTAADYLLLVLETGESDALAAPGESGAPVSPGGLAERPDPARPLDLPLEPYSYRMLTPVELAGLCNELAAAAGGLSAGEAAILHSELAALQSGWAAAFARYGHGRAGELSYQDVLLRYRRALLPLLTRRGIAPAAATVIDTAIAVAPPIAVVLHRPPPPLPAPPVAAVERAIRGSDGAPPLFSRPLFVMSAPRAGSTVLFDLLSRLPQAVTLGGESHEVIRSIAALHPAARGYASDALSAAEATPEVADELRRALAARLRRRDGTSLFAGPAAPEATPPRFIEKTPANALRIPFLRSVFPDAQFIYLTRGARDNISSLLEGWRERRFLAYRQLPGWPHEGWSFLLPPGWQDLSGRPLVEIAAFQYRAANAAIARDLADLPPSHKICVQFADLLADPGATLRRLADFAGLTLDAQAEAAATGGMKPSTVTLSAPRPGKWRRHADELATVLPRLAGDGQTRLDPDSETAPASPAIGDHRREA